MVHFHLKLKFLINFCIKPLLKLIKIVILYYNGLVFLVIIIIFFFCSLLIKTNDFFR